MGANQVLSIVLPVFILIGVGYLVARIGLMSQTVGEALGEYVYVIAIPVLVFKTLAVVNLDGQSPWAIWIAYFSGMAATWIAGNLMIRKVFGREARAGVIGGISAAFANTVMVGLPLVSQVYGDAGLVPLLLIISVHLPAMTAATAVLMERAAALDGVSTPPPMPELLKRIGKNLIVNPIVVAITCSLIWRATSLPIEGLFQDILNRISATALPVALLSLGMSMVTYGIRGNVLPGFLLSVLKLGFMPATVFVMSAYVVHLPPLWTAVATLTATCPTGVNAYIFANRYGTGHAMSTNAITLTTAAAVVTSGLWYAFLETWRAF
ncbi:AEC family transporter [uncultured Roseibium sp.]|uniref:AEC family transporter n=1 Tax=uncultured Roseibium sp. TaxID=1936171 RepID=UPI003218048C